MVEFIEKYWQQGLFLIIVSALTWTVKKLQTKVKVEICDYSLVKEGMLAILHDRLYQNCQYHIQQGYCSLEDAKNLEFMFKAYHGLGGNGTCSEIYGRCCKLPYDK